ncbi:MAG: alpha/beta hydrolase [Gammaproteobacteria bacterium]
MLTFEYLARAPVTPAGGRPPLLVLLHGIGGNEGGLFELAPRIDPRFLVVSPRAPFENTPGQYRWFDVEFTSGSLRVNVEEAESARLRTLQFINDVVMGYGADPRQVYLFGFSQGATLAYSLLLTAPARMRGAVLVAGRVLPEIAPLAADAASLRHLTLLIQHGREDPVMPLTRGVAARDLFADLGVPLGYREHPGGHRLSDAMTDEALTFLTVQLDRATRREIESPA